MPTPAGGGLHRHRATGQLARLDRGEGEGVDAALGLDRGRLDRLAGLGGDRLRQVLDPLADQLGGAVEVGGALVLGEVGGLEGLAGGLDGAVDGAGVTERDAPDRAAVVGALDLAPLAGLDPLAGHEKLVIDRVHRLRSHSALLRRFRPA